MLPNKMYIERRRRWRNRHKESTNINNIINNEFQFTTPTGYNATFYDANTPYCWYVVNAPPCYDLKSGTFIHRIFISTILAFVS
jgi:hypothetical protein